MLAKFRALAALLLVIGLLAILAISGCTQIENLVEQDPCEREHNTCIAECGDLKTDYLHDMCVATCKVERTRCQSER